MSGNWRMAMVAAAGVLSAAQVSAAVPALEPQAAATQVVEVGNARFTVLTPRLLRLEWSASGEFEDRATLTFVNRRLSSCEFQVRRMGEGCVIETPALRLEYLGGRFTPNSLTVRGIASAPGARFEWHPGQAADGNLYGTRRTLDGISDYAGMLSGMEPGLLSRDGWSVVDDTRSPVFVPADGAFSEWVAPPLMGDRQDWYFFGYGHDYRAALQDYTLVAGKIPLPPKWMFGYWWSRYWLYSEREARELVDMIRHLGIPMDVMILDMDWHDTWEFGRWGFTPQCTIDESGSVLGWCSYSWNRQLFPEPAAAMAELHARQLKVGANLHPYGGIEPREQCYAAFKREYGWPSDRTIPYHLAQAKWADCYSRLTLAPLERDGIDFWWLDWQQWTFDRDLPELNSVFWNNHFFFQRGRSEKGERRRPAIYHRWGGMGSHRYQVGFTGDAYVKWDVLRFLPWFTATAANVGYGYWGHDIGGHLLGKLADGSPDPLGRDPDLFLRWLQSGVFTPIFRTHSCKSPDIERRFWMYPNELRELREAVRLRYRLTPYIYTAARTAYDTGVSPCRPLYYDSPESPEAYDPHARAYMLGDAILAGTIADPRDAVTRLSDCTFWFPAGRWFDVETGTLLEGGRTNAFRRTPSENPWFVKAGSVLPLYPDDVMSLQAATGERMVLAVYPGAESGAGELYEDAGDDVDYAEHFARTAFKWQRDGRVLRLEIGARRGSYAQMPARRDWEVRFVNRLPPAAVRVNGRPAMWRYVGDDFTLVVEVAAADPAVATTLEVEWSAAMLAAEPRLNGLRGRVRRASDLVYDYQLEIQAALCCANPPDAFLAQGTLGSRLQARPEATLAALDDFDRARREFLAAYRDQREAGGIGEDFHRRITATLEMDTPALDAAPQPSTL